MKLLSGALRLKNMRSIMKVRPQKKRNFGLDYFCTEEQCASNWLWDVCLVVEILRHVEGGSPLHCTCVFTQRSQSQCLSFTITTLTLICRCVYET